jgi:hypothetical protein
MNASPTSIAAIGAGLIAFTIDYQYVHPRQQAFLRYEQTERDHTRVLASTVMRPHFSYAQAAPEMMAIIVGSALLAGGLARITRSRYTRLKLARSKDAASTNYQTEPQSLQ